MDKSLMTLGQVIDQVETMSKNCTDSLAPVKEIEFDHLESVRIGSEAHKLRPIAQRSVCYRMGIPFYYLAKCPHDLQKENMNYWWDKERNEELFFRFDGDEVRAMFTPKYKPVDNFEVLERVSVELGMQRDKFLISVETKVQDPFSTILNFNKQFQIGKPEQAAVEFP